MGTRQYNNLNKQRIMKNIRLMSSVLGLLLAFFVSVGAYAQDITLSVDKQFFKPGTTATVTVKVDSKVTFGAISTKISLPEGLSFVVDKATADYTDFVFGRTELTKKCTMLLTGNGSVATFMAAKANDFAPVSADLFTFDVEVAKDFAVNEQIKFSNIEAVFTDTTVEPWAQTKYVQKDFTVNACNEEMLFTPSVKDFTIKAGETKKLEFHLDYADYDFQGFEFNILLPEGLSINEDSYVGSETRIPNHFITVKKSGRIGVQPDGTGKEFNIQGRTGMLFTFEVTASKEYKTPKSEIKFYDFEAVTKSVNGKVGHYYAKDFTVGVELGNATGINGINADEFGEGADGIYQLNGVRTDKLQRGVNIVVKNGKAVKVVKK